MSAEAILLTGIGGMVTAVSFLTKILLSKWNASDKYSREWQNKMLEKVDLLNKNVSDGNTNHRLLELKAENLAMSLHEYKQETNVRISELRKEIDALKT